MVPVCVKVTDALPGVDAYRGKSKTSMNYFFFKTNIS